MRGCRRCFLSFSTVLLLFFTACGGEPEPEIVLPSEAMDRISTEVNTTILESDSREERMEKHAAIAQKWLDKTRSEGLSREEQLVYADLLLTAKHTEEGTALMRALSHGEDLVARRAWRNVLMEAFFEGRHDEFRTLLDDYHTRLTPDPRNLEGVSRPLGMMITYLQNEERYDAARNMLETHLAWLEADAPYEAWGLLANAKPIYEALNETNQWTALRNRALIDLRDGLVSLVNDDGGGELSDAMRALIQRIEATE